jgi:para-nitrobenzyl esterase
MTYPNRLLQLATIASAVAILSTLLTACGGGGDDAADPTVVATDKGAVHGTSTTAMRQFKGIPYAAPPVGALRWAPPQSAATWTTTREASAFANHCPQTAGSFGVASTTEDCLYLNVYTPTTAGPYPVMVWIHGGSLVTGESDDYDATQLVAQGIAVVTINYRVGALGFLAHPALNAESKDGVSGNYGLLDQQAAMQWVKTNIAAFGGDPAKVTIAGESAGGFSVLSQIASPLAKGLFSQAIVESGAYSLSQATLATAQVTGQSFATKANCIDQSLACLRALPVATVLQFQPAAAPTVDGKVLPATLTAAFGAGTYNKVPVLEGSNSHEYSLLSAAATDVALGRPINASEYATNITATFKTLAPAVLAQYPLSGAPSPAWASDQVLTDTAFSCGGRAAAKLLTATGSTVYAYEFNDANAPMVFNLPLDRPEGFGAYHASELQYVFPGNQHIYQGAPFTATQQALSAQMIKYWAQFVASGNPNGGSSPNWPAYTAANDTYQSLTPGAIAPTTQFSTTHKCVFWTGS